MNNSELLKRYGEKRPQKALFSDSDRELIIDRANQRGFFVLVGRRMYRASITGTRLFYPQVVVSSTNQVFQITWQKAYQLSQGTTTLKFQ